VLTNVADKINLTTLEIVLIILAILLFLSHIGSLVIFIYWNVGNSPTLVNSSLFTRCCRLHCAVDTLMLSASSFVNFSYTYQYFTECFNLTYSTGTHFTFCMF